jgi:hypothetical protein
MFIFVRAAPAVKGILRTRAKRPHGQVLGNLPCPSRSARPRHIPANDDFGLPSKMDMFILMAEIGRDNRPPVQAAAADGRGDRRR